MAVQMDNENIKGEKTQPTTGESTLPCSSCCICATNDKNQFYIGGQYNNELELLAVNRDGNEKDTIRFTTNAGLTTTDYYFDGCSSNINNNKNRVSAFARNKNDPKELILFALRSPDYNDLIEESYNV